MMLMGSIPPAGIAQRARAACRGALSLGACGIEAQTPLAVSAREAEE